MFERHQEEDSHLSPIFHQPLTLYEGIIPEGMAKLFNSSSWLSCIPLYSFEEHGECPSFPSQYL